MSAKVGEEDDDGEWVAPERERLFLAGDCDALLGRGKATLGLTPEAALSTTKLDVGGHRATVAFSHLAGYTLLTKDFADRAEEENKQKKRTNKPKNRAEVL